MNAIAIDANGLMPRAVVLEADQMIQIAVQEDADSGLGFLDQLEGNVYLGRVQKLMSGMNAAFIDIGLKESAYLHFRDAVPTQTSGMGKNKSQKTEGQKSPSKISELIKNGQELLVQVHSVGSGFKGAKVTMKLALPGKYVILMPTVSQQTVSRKFKQQALGQALLEGVKLLPGFAESSIGFIIRTEAEQATADQVLADAERLYKKWQRLEQQKVTQKAPKLVSRAPDPIERLLLDHLNEETVVVHINQQKVYEDLMMFLGDTALAPLSNKLKLEARPLLFTELGLEKAFKGLLSRRVELPSGGFLIIDETEAMTIIDVNSGSSKGDYSQRQLIFSTNYEAAEAAAREIKLRNLNGIILIDFIDMSHEPDKQKLMSAFKHMTSKDPAGVHVTGFSELGIMEMTRRRVGKRLSEVIYRPCGCCELGKRLKLEWLADEWIREVQQKFKQNPTELMVYEFEAELYQWLNQHENLLRRYLENVTSDIQYVVTHTPERPFKMTYMGRYKRG